MPARNAFLKPGDMSVKVWAVETDFHGVGRAFNTENKMIRRIVWGVISVTAAIALTVFLIYRFQAYYSYNATTETTMTVQSVLQYPAITVCPSKSFDIKSMSPLDMLRVGGPQYGLSDFSILLPICQNKEILKSLSQLPSSLLPPNTRGFLAEDGCKFIVDNQEMLLKCSPASGKAFDYSKMTSFDGEPLGGAFQSATDFYSNNSSPEKLADGLKALQDESGALDPKKVADIVKAPTTGGSSSSDDPLSQLFKALQSPPQLPQLNLPDLPGRKKRQAGDCPANNDDYDFQQFITNNSLTQQEVIQKCEWDGTTSNTTELCRDVFGEGVITEVLMKQFGKCYTVNPGGVISGGVASKLSLIMPASGFVDPFQYGVRVHEPGTPPTRKTQDMYEIGNGGQDQTYLLALAGNKVISMMEAPYSDCEPSDGYSYEKCYQGCVDQIQYKTKGCATFDSSLLGRNDSSVKECRGYEKNMNTNIVTSKVASGTCSNLCKTACRFTVYQKDFRVSHAQSEQSEKAKANNGLLLQIYFTEPLLQLIEQKPAYTWENLLAEIGGNMGLFLGASILTCLHLAEFLIADVLFGYCRGKNTSNHRVNESA